MPEQSDNANSRPYEPSTEHRVFESPWVDVYYDDITHFDGRAGKYAWIKSNSGRGAVMTIPVTPSERYLLIKVYRHPSKQYLWEFPAGLIDEGESPVETARRELVEETGITPLRTTLLGSQTPVAGYSGDLFHSVLTEIPEISVEDISLQSAEGIVDAKLLTRSEIVDFLREQDFGDGITLTCIAHYWMWQEQQERGTRGEQ